MKILLLLLGWAGLLLVRGQERPELNQLRLNQIQAIATAKSFHLGVLPLLGRFLYHAAGDHDSACLNAPADAVLSYLDSKSWGLHTLQIPQQFKFDHLTITQQLNQGIRNLEIWVMDDYSGGLYSTAAGLKLAGVDGDLTDPTLKTPGYKLLEQADWDYNSTVYLLNDFIAEVLNWTTANPGHLPLVIVVHPASSGVTGDVVSDAAKAHLADVTLKTSSVQGPTSFISPQALGDGSAYPAPTDLQKFDTTLRTLVNASKLITPDDIRLKNATLRQAVFPPSQWPTIADLRDKIMFVADPGYIKDYNTAFANLSGAVMFTSDDQSSDDVNVVWLDVEVDTSVIDGYFDTVSFNNKISSSANTTVDSSAKTIREQVQAGFMVRSAVDKNLVEAFNNYEYRYQQFSAVGGAHYLMTSTEVVQSRLINGSSYAVNTTTVPAFNGRAMICNPVTTSLFTNSTANVTNGSAAVVACPYNEPVPAGVVTSTNSTTNLTSTVAASSVSAASPASAPSTAPAQGTAPAPAPSAAGEPMRLRTVFAVSIAMLAMDLVLS